jgi:GxxExxY protein
MTEQVIGLAIEVHRNIVPGLLEAGYEQRLCVELRRAGVAFKRQVPIPILYKGEQVGDGFKADVVVAEQLIVETKSFATILTVHEMQLRTYPHERHSRRVATEFQRAPADGWPPPLRCVVVCSLTLSRWWRGSDLGQLATSPRHVRRTINRSKSLSSGISTPCPDRRAWAGNRSSFCPSISCSCVSWCRIAR